MYSRSQAPRTGSRSLATPLARTRAWASPGAAEEETAVSPGCHDLAYIDVSAPIQRVRSRTGSLNDLADDEQLDQDVRRPRANSLPNRVFQAPNPPLVAAVPPLPPLHAPSASSLPPSLPMAPPPSHLPATALPLSSLASDSIVPDVEQLPSPSPPLQSQPPQSSPQPGPQVAPIASTAVATSAQPNIDLEAVRQRSSSPPPQSQLSSSSPQPEPRAAPTTSTTSTSARTNVVPDVTQLPSSPPASARADIVLDVPQRSPSPPPQSHLPRSSPEPELQVEPTTSTTSASARTTGGPKGGPRSYGTMGQDEIREDEIHVGNIQHAAEDVRRPLLPRSRQTQPITRQNWLDFATANTPGPITGLSGGVNSASSLMNPPSTNVPSSFGNSGFVNAMSPLSRGATATSAATNVATGLADVTAIVSDAVSAHNKGGWSRFWKGLKANFRNPFAKPKDTTAEAAEGRSEAKRLVVNTATNAADLGANQIPSAISSVGTLTGHAAPAVLGTVSAAAGMGISSVVAARSLWRGGRAARHESNVNALLAENAAARNGLVKDDQNPDLTAEMEAAAKHHSEQMNKRKKRSLIGAAGATLGAVGGGLLLGGLLGASMLTPIGWGLAAAGGLVAAGLGAHKLYRWWKKRKEGTLGRARDTHANAIYDAMQQPQESAEHQSARRLLKARGITPQQLHGDRGEAINLLKRKAEAW